MSPLQEHLVFLDDHLNPLSDAFYGELFRAHPHVKSFFGVASRAAKKQMLRQILGAVLQLDDEPWVREELAAVGERHQDLEIPAQSYRWVQDALLTALARVSGDLWTPELAALWTEQLDRVSAATEPALETA